MSGSCKAVFPSPRDVRRRVGRPARRTARRRRPRALAFAVAGVALVAGLAPLAAQEDPEGLARECMESSGFLDAELLRWCRETAMAARAVQGEVALAAAGGSDVPGTPSTVGWRLGTMPRIAVALRVGATGAAVPDVRRFRTLQPAPEASFVAPSLQAQAVLGIFQGFSPAPTVGGILSVDLLVGGSLVFLPEDRGFDGNAAGYLLGARLGLLQESFTLPGISLGVARRGLGSVRLGSEADDGEVDAGLDVTSVRLTAGKDFLALGILAGVGWDRVTGDLRIRARHVEAGLVAAEGRATSGDFETSRLTYFAGVSLPPYLIVQLSAEGGWAEGFDISGTDSGGYDPTEGSFFGSLSLRVTF